VAQVPIGIDFFVEAHQYQSGACDLKNMGIKSAKSVKSVVKILKYN
jgi:hypothetical protein